MAISKGDKIGAWLVISNEIRGKEARVGKRSFLCRCICGIEREVRTYYLENNKSKSCGCVQTPPNKRHGRARTNEYRAWQGMLNRCRNKNHGSFHRYGDRGIKVCERWQVFENFLEDMGERPKGATIDRIDNDGDYTLSNCRWISPIENSWNKGEKGKIYGIRKVGKSFQAYIGAKYDRKYLGSTRDYFEACCLRKSAEAKFWVL